MIERRKDPPPREAVQLQKNEAIAELAQAFTNPVRLQLLGILNQAESSVDVLAKKIGQTRANTSAQLQALTRAHLVDSRRSGRNIYYRIRDDRVRELWSLLQRVAAEEAPGFRSLIGSYFEEAEPFTRKDGLELLAAVKSGDLILLDLRPGDEYEAGHLPGAFSIPHEELEARISELPKSKPIVAYCRGRFCVIAADMVEYLRRNGRKARNLHAGPPDWRRLGLPIAKVA